MKNRHLSWSTLNRPNNTYEQGKYTHIIHKKRQHGKIFAYQFMGESFKKNVIDDFFYLFDFKSFGQRAIILKGNKQLWKLKPLT